MDNPTALDPQLDSAQMSMMRGLGELAAYLGFNRTLGHVYGVLLLCNRPLTLEDLAQRIDKSKASVCQQTQILARLGMVCRVDGPRLDQGTRRIYYRVEPDLERVAQTLARRKVVELDQLDAAMAENFRRLQGLRGQETAPTETLDLLVSRVDALCSLLHVMTGFIAEITESVPDGTSTAIPERSMDGG